MKSLRIVPLALVLAIAIPWLQGCSSENPPPPPDTVAQQAPPPPPPSEPDSVLGAGIHFVGTVIMFPFRLVGDALGLIV